MQHYLKLEYFICHFWFCVYVKKDSECADTVATNFFFDVFVHEESVSDSEK